MQPSIDNYSVSRRVPDVEDYIEIVRRHKAWLLGATYLGLVAAVVVAFLWPDTYVSVAVIRVVPPQIPQSYVPTNVNIALGQRINSMAASILSRAALTNLITTYNLYPNDRKSRPMEDLIERMRGDVVVGEVRSYTRGSSGSMSAFEVGFSYSDRYQAQKVAADLVGRFIEENIRTRSSQSVVTTQFLKEQLQDVKQELETAEQRVRDFRIRNAGKLPEQGQIIAAQISSLENRLAGLESSIHRAGNAKLLHETQMQILRSQLNYASEQVEVTAVSATARNDRLSQLDRDIGNLEMVLASLRERYKDTHPDVQRVQAQIGVLEAAKASLLNRESEKGKNTEGNRTPGRRTAMRDPAQVKELEASLARLQSEMQVADIEFQDLLKQKKALEQQIQEAQKRLEATPLGEGEYSLLVKQRELARTRYEEFEKKLAQSELATDVETRRQGETLELLDPAPLPQTPTAPKRPMIIFFGLAVGAGVGLGMSAVRELRDTSLKNLKDVRAYTKLSVLASIPLLENDLVVRRRRRLNWLAWSTVCLMGLLIMGGTIAYYYQTKV